MGIYGCNYVYGFYSLLLVKGVKEILQIVLFCLYVCSVISGYMYTKKILGSYDGCM